MNNATHKYTDPTGTVYVRLVVERDNGMSSARVVSDQRSAPELPGAQIVIASHQLKRL